MSLCLLWVCTGSVDVGVVSRNHSRLDASAVTVVWVMFVLVNEMVLLGCHNE
jgi:hypothetical protein